MGEIEQEVKTFMVGYLCDDCGRGFMEYAEDCLYVSPLLYIHKCDKCGSKKNFETKYPPNIPEEYTMIDNKAHTIYLVEGIGQIKEINDLSKLKKGNLIKSYDMDYSIITNDCGEYIFRIAEIENGDIKFEPEAYKNKDLPTLFKGDMS